MGQARVLDGLCLDGVAPGSRERGGGLGRYNEVAVHKLTQRMERWSRNHFTNVPESFKQICDELAE